MQGKKRGIVKIAKIYKVILTRYEQISNRQDFLTDISTGKG
jgi:hypothetical protein